MQLPWRVPGLSLALFVALCAAHGGAAVAQESLFAVAVGPGQIRVDGELGEWRSVKAHAIGRDDSARMEARLAYDANGLYVAGRVWDDTFVRTKTPSAREDAIVLTLGLPTAQRFVAHELWLYAGQPGQTAATIKDASGRALPKPALLVEAPAEGGYTLEAFIPWQGLAGGRDYAFARAALRMHDVDRAGSKGITVGAASSRVEDLPWLMLDGGPAAALGGFARDKSVPLGAAKFDAVAELRGDERLERVVVLGTYVVLAYDGQRLSFADLPVTTAAGVKSVELRDLTTDGRPELVLRLRQQNELGTRELLQVWDLGRDPLRPMFALETSKETSEGQLDTRVELRAARPGEPSIVVRAGRAEGLSAANYQETPASGVEPVLLPWGPVAERAYAWDGSRFSIVSERENPNASRAKPSAERAASPASATPAAKGSVVHDEPPTMAALLDAYREQRGVPPNVLPRFVTHANLAGDKRLESIVLLGSELVVMGEGYRNGESFFYFGLPVRDPAHVQRVFTADVTGDGRREIFVRIKQVIGEVQRELLLGYTFEGESLRPILTAEVRRARGVQSIGNVVSLVKRRGHFALRIEPGLAQGWDAANYPFAPSVEEETAPLLLPWQDAPSDFDYDGSRLRPSRSK